MRQGITGAAQWQILEPDEQLMLRLGQDDWTCLEELVERHREALVHYLYRMVQDQEAAEDLAQEVFLRVFRARARYQPVARFTTWLYRIATNLALNWLRGQKAARWTYSLDAPCRDGRAFTLRDHGRNIEQRLVERSLAERVRRAVAALPARQRAVIILHKYHELDHEQIARILGCSVQAVKSLAFRGYANLRRQLVGAYEPACVAGRQ